VAEGYRCSFHQSSSQLPGNHHSHQETLMNQETFKKTSQNRQRQYFQNNMSLNIDERENKQIESSPPVRDHTQMKSAPRKGISWKKNSRKHKISPKIEKSDWMKIVHLLQESFEVTEQASIRHESAAHADCKYPLESEDFRNLRRLG
jgi:hypothetical protein